MEAYTPARVVTLLQRAGYPVTQRQLRDWVNKGALPHPTPRGLGQGKGKVYCWPQRTIVKQAATVWRLLAWYGRMRPVPFMLWLLGYEVSLAVVREELRQQVEVPADQLLEGVNPEDYEQLADRLSALAVQAYQQARRKREEQVVQEEVLELYLNLQLNPQYQPSDTVLRAVVEVLNKNKRQQAAKVGETEEPSAAQLDQVQSLLDFLQQHLSHARIVEALSTVSDAELEQAREGFGRMLRLLERVVAFHFREKTFWPEFKYNVVGNLGKYTIPWMLTLRREGYGAWIDKALKWVGTFETTWRTDSTFRHAVQLGDLETAIPRFPFFAEEGDFDAPGQEVATEKGVGP